ncbi:hypothetical protein B0T18DRAFT_483906 [Schizothecium vesticola]|uniref:Uncharacterized protein n=1 Tax=Schizothecium vesticola TaxID=314040 RepID=A0AA40F8C1_9PEZI|nr:hypothetical protein B0T18DRAFT_483906 [Schizothecium vesticola]
MGCTGRKAGALDAGAGVLGCWCWGGSSSPELVGWFVVVGRVQDSRWRMARDLEALFWVPPAAGQLAANQQKGAMGAIQARQPEKATLESSRVVSSPKPHTSPPPADDLLGSMRNGEPLFIPILVHPRSLGPVHVDADRDPRLQADLVMRSRAHTVGRTDTEGGTATVTVPIGAHPVTDFPSSTGSGSG